MQVTIDSRDRLEDVLRIVGSVYGVTLTVGSTEDAAAEPAASTTPRKRANRRTAGKQSTPRRGRRSAAPTKLDMASVRSWAREQGHDVSDRGRVPNAVLDAYRDRADAS